MTTYTTQIDKNGKELYYRVTDGKKKNVSRAEYEANKSQSVISEQQEQIAADNDVFAEIEICNNLPDGVKSEYYSEPIPQRLEKAASYNIEAAALDIVQKIIETTDDSRKLTLKISKNFALILYRNCSICGLMYSKDGAITKISFMEKTPEARKKFKATRYEFNGLDDITNRRDEILNQVNFINEWHNAERSA